MSEDCEGPYFMVGDEVTAFDPENESTELRLSDPDVFFPPAEDCHSDCPDSEARRQAAVNWSWMGNAFA